MERASTTLPAKRKLWHAGIVAGVIVTIAVAFEPTPLRLVAVAGWFLILAILQLSWFHRPV